MPGQRPIEETVLDGPVTPAPVFAYRAVRGLFFASPESSPERERQRNKENVPLPSKSPAKCQTLTENAPSTPSQKRKRDTVTVLSPTKGILRTPGLATPRAKALRDVNVKFKSVSPEGLESAATATAVVTDSRQPEPSKESSKTFGNVRSAVTTSSVVPTSSYAMTSNWDAYVRRTEHEMKKVVRYGQKMREYARQKDTENAELKGMVERLRRENERLKQLVSESPDVGSKTRTTLAERTAAAKARHEPVERVETLAEQRPGRSGRADDAPPAQAGEALAVRKSLAEYCDGSLAKRKPPATTDQNKPIPQTNTNSTQPLDKHGQSPRRFQSLPIHPSTATRHSASHTGHVASSAHAGGMTGSVRLPPERLAAARARLRQRAEARKASVDNNETHILNDGREPLVSSLGVVDDGPNHQNPSIRANGRHPTDKTAQPNILDIREQSLVDWANL